MNTKTDLPSRNSPDLAPERIARLLTRAAQRLDDNTVVKLRCARNIALERQPQSKPVFALSAAHGIHWLLPHSAHRWVAMILLLAMMLFGSLSYWQHRQESDLIHLDTAILTDELPLEVFVD